MDIHIKTIPHKDQRYETLGDWFFEGDDLTILVSDFGDWRYNVLVGIHEAVEAILCRDRGISEESVTEFDLAHLEEEEPGFHKDAPYYKEHQIADVIERIMASELNINWKEYEETPTL